MSLVYTENPKFLEEIRKPQLKDYLYTNITTGIASILAYCRCGSAENSGQSYLGLPHGLLPLFIVIDYVEIPALVSGITFYLFSIFKHEDQSRKNLVFLILLAAQVVHIFWITDEVVYESFFDQGLVTFPEYLAWVAILIDYLEIPVMIDLFYKTFKIKKDISPKK